MSDTKSGTYYDFHKPVLPDGDYSIAVKHVVNIGTNSATFQSPVPAGTTLAPNTVPTTIEFYVEGPRFAIDRALVHSVYPPIGGKGDYRADLPSLVLTRSTLPWERFPGATEVEGNSASWLFLLLVDESEAPKVTVQRGVQVSTVKTALGLTDADTARLPATLDLLGIAPSMSALFPRTLRELQYLSYVRKRDEQGAASSAEQAVLLCNRVPKAGSTSKVYLVSIENNYEHSGSEWNFAGIPLNGQLVFPLLHEWQFHAFDDELHAVSQSTATKYAAQYPGLQGLVDEAYSSTDAFTVALTSIGVAASDASAIAKISKLQGATFHGLLSSLKGGLAPLQSSAAASPGLQATGTVSVPYRRVVYDTAGHGLPTVGPACYRGPLTGAPIGAIDENFPLISNGTASPAYSSPKSSDELVLTDASGNTDRSYAAAWELGRMTALGDASFSIPFFRWKSAVAASRRAEAIKAENPWYPSTSHLPVGDAQPSADLPSDLAAKLESWKRLTGIPVRYILPDPELCPCESIRICRLDPNWINAFMSGVFSIGHTVGADLSDIEQTAYLDPNVTISGFVINSLAVSAWPDFEVDVTLSLTTAETSTTATISVPPKNPSDAASLYAKVDLDVDTRLYLFTGAITNLSFHLHPAKLHSGFLFGEDGFEKEVPGTTSHLRAPVDKNGVVDIRGLVQQSSPTGGATPTVSEFARFMLEGTPAVEFPIG